MAGAGSSSVSLTYTADIKPMIADLKKGLASVSGMTEAEARKWTKSVDDSFKKIAKGQQGVGESAKNAEKNVQGMGTSLRQIGTQMPDVVTQLGGGADAMQVLVQQGGQVVQQMMATGGAMGVLLGPIGALAAGLGALGVAYVAITGSVEREIEAQKALADINRSTEATSRKLAAAYVDQAVALGLVTEAEGREAHAQAATRQAVLDFAAAQKEQKAAIDDTIKSAGRYVGVLDYMRGSTDAVLPIMAEAVDGLFDFTGKLKAAENQDRALGAALVKTAKEQKELKTVTLETAAATDKNKEADKEATDEAKKRAAALKDLRDILTDAGKRDVSAVRAIVDARDEELRQIDALEQISGDHAAAEAARQAVKLQAMDKLKALEAGVKTNADSDKLTAVDKILAKRDDELKKLDEIEQLTAGAADTEAERLAVMERAERELQELRGKSLETLQKRQDAAHEKELKQIQQRRAAYLQAGDTIAGSLATVGEALQNIEGATEDQRMAAFRAMKGIAIAQAVINTAQAVTAALTLPPPLGEIAAVAVGAAGAAQVAVIAATEPSFHQGGVDFGLAPDEIRTQRKTGVEGTLTGRGVRAVGGPAGVEAANKGQAPGGGGAPRVIAVLTPPGAPARLLQDATRSRAGAALVQDAARPSALRVRR